MCNQSNTNSWKANLSNEAELILHSDTSNALPHVLAAMSEVAIPSSAVQVITVYPVSAPHDWEPSKTDGYSVGSGI